jgi:hypothetical protein
MHMIQKRIAIRAAVITVASLLAVLGLGTTANAATAASAASASVTPATTYYNFEVEIATHYSDKIDVCGYNQRGDYICSGWIKSPNYWTAVTGWWWNGAAGNFYGLDIYGYQNSTGVTRYKQWYLPVTATSPWQWLATYKNL